MYAFRCPHCFKINISVERDRCSNCGNGNSREPTIAKKKTQGNFIIKEGGIFLNRQNKGARTDFNLVSQESEKLNERLQENDEKDNDTEILDVSLSHISSPKGELVRPIAENSISKEIITSPDQTACSSVNIGRHHPLAKSGAVVPAKILQHTSEQSSRHRSKNIEGKKAIKPNKNAKIIQNENTIIKMNLGTTFTKDNNCSSQLKDNQGKTNPVQLSSERNPKIKNSISNDSKIVETFTRNSVSHEGSMKSNLGEKLPINRIITPTLKKIFLCNKCGKKFTHESKFNVHFLKHLKEKPFKCGICDKKYYSEAHLKRHYKSHMDNGRYKCDLCNFEYTRHCHLSRHRKKHILESAVNVSADQQKVEHNSQEKEEETSDDDDPQKNIGTLTENKIFLCTECGVRFIHESDFKAHSLRHSVQTPFKCNVCDKEFRYEVYLNRHYRVHSLERPFSCDICGFKSSQISSLNKHLQIHTPEKVL